MLLKKWSLRLFISLFILSPHDLMPSTQTQIHYPEIEFKYDWRGRSMDFIGSLYYGNPVTNELIKQLEKQLPDLIATWQKDAPVLGRIDQLFV